MPKIAVVFYRDSDGSIPIKKWIDNVVAKRDRRAVAKLLVRINMLREDGRDLRIPVVDYLRDGIYELRSEFGGVNYRLLYFFSRNTAVVISHGCTKESVVPDSEIDLAIQHRFLFESDPERYTYYGDI